MPSHHIRNISLSTFTNALSRYPASAPESLRELDTQRYETIPTAFAKRVASIEESFLLKEEVEKLVEWKLKHGTFRPKLLSLVQSNHESYIDSVTRAAFDQLPDTKLSTKDVLAAVKKLSELKGIGPATASLLLSVGKPKEVPFFSDELFRWCVWDEQGGPGGWKRKIKYNAKEYEQVVEAVEVLWVRLGGKVRAVDIERVAWVLGKEGVTVGEEGDDGESEKEDTSEKIEEDAEEEVKAEPKKEVKKGTKRKAPEPKASSTGTRKSTRTKK
ncbi:hypothetical protein FB567DRAFT_586023 [Paraphoma chrysanthemicola]|uniref:Uncharacterized protein n=1 Tax=Paraphoma chrysanthemicola TaxID=798071 RepID=A0A8K0RH03_9PLEO|nr:hypothetical protein FB567DRAFT_586023 [Paraphoma chrysanthemicola]